MTEEFAAFLDAFKNATVTDDGDEHVRARADYTTNTLRVNEAADDPYGMTLIHALVSREEFMHGEWSVGLVNSLSRLKLAAIDALYDVLDDPSVREDRLRTLYDAWLAAQTVDAAVEPFQEAVDKLQILSVVYGDIEFRSNIQETFAAVYGDEYDDHQIDDKLLDEIETQTQIARGAVQAEDGGSLYVNPLYYHALGHATGTDGNDDATTSDAQRELDRLSERRSVAETVAQVTLDIPSPIAPLGPDAPYDPLQVDGLDVDPIDLTDLKDRYRVTDDALETHLLTHADSIANDEVRAALGTDATTYEDTWLDHVFVSTLQALDGLDEEIDGRVHELHADDLRRRLTERVHGVDLDDETMLDRPTPLLEVPAAATTDVPDQDLIGVEKEPLPKVLIEAFEQHGSFGAVVFQPTDGEAKRQLNYHAVDDDLAENADVPDGIDSYQALWEHYFVGKELLNTLFVRRHEYEQHIREAFGEGFEDVYALRAALETVDFDAVDNSMMASDDARTDLQPDTGLASLSIDAETVASTGNTTLDDADFGSDDNTAGAASDTAGSSRDEASDDDELTDSDTSLLSEQMGLALDDYTLDELRTAATRLEKVDAVDIDAVEFDDIECPLCAVIADPCGGDTCVTATVRASYDDQFPALLDDYLALEAAHLQQ